MADGSNINVLPGLDSSLKSSSQSQKKAKNGEQIGKTEFLQLLVTQLKNQDPLNPMENQEFAVQLAQFSSLEQLVSINDKIGANSNSGGAGDLGSLASYLGHEVVVNSDVAHVEDHQGGKISVNLPTDAAGLRIELLNADGSVAETAEVGPVSKGKHVIELKDLATANGDYKVRAVGLSTTGSELQTQVYVDGIVTGFIPGADPKLIVNGKEIGASEIREVHLPTA